MKQLPSFLAAAMMIVSNSHAQPGATLKTETKDGALTISSGKQDLLRYQFATVYPPAGIDTNYKRSGFIHPLWTPHGQVLTRIQPADHYHHYGIWNPWTHTLFENDTVDFWNLSKKQGTVRFVKMNPVNIDASKATFETLHDHVVFKKDGTEKIALKEWQTITVHAPGNKDHYYVDIVSKMQCASQSPLLLLTYRYGGFGWRTTEVWDNKNSEVLTSGGNTRKDVDGSLAKWCIVQGALGNDHGGLVLLSHPGNYNHPEPLRIWPEDQYGRGDLFVNISPTKNKDWLLEPGKTYTLKYRLVVFNGKFNSDMAEKEWRSFSLRSPQEISQPDSILSGVFHWKSRETVGRTLPVVLTPLFEGKAHDMEWLQMNAANMRTQKSQFTQQVPDNEEHLFLIRSGKLTLTIKDSTWQLSPASVALLLPGESYSLRNMESDSCHFYILKYRSKLPIDMNRGKAAGGSIVKDITKLTFITQERGGRVNYFERPTAMCKRFEMHTTTLKEGLISHAPHTHPAEEIVLVINGKTEMVIGDRTYPGTAGDVYYLGSNVLHGIKNVGRGTCTYFAFQFD